MSGRAAVLIRFACVLAFAALALGVSQSAASAAPAAAASAVHPAADESPGDQDFDGIPDDQDACPDVAGVPENYGCPYVGPVDSDGDGVTDDKDQCVSDPGSPNYQGCPAPDSDGDGRNDEIDACPSLPGPYDGCPLPDFDGDGVYDDGSDQCPDQAGPASNNGCPLPDSDNDGVDDAADRCVDAAGPADNDGCPLTKVTPAAVAFTDRCGTSNDTATVPTSTGVGYYYLDKPVAAGRYPVRGTIRVEARAAKGYELTGTTTWSATFSTTACRVGNVVVTSPAKTTVRVENREAVTLTITSGKVSGRVGPNRTVSFYAPAGTYAWSVTWAGDLSPAKGRVRVR